MEEIIRLAAIDLTDTEKILYSNANGAVIKTIMLYNSNSTEKEISLKLDSLEFKLKLATRETKIIDSHVVSNLVEATGLGVNIHISGLQLGGA